MRHIIPINVHRSRQGTSEIIELIIFWNLVDIIYRCIARSKQVSGKIEYLEDEYEEIDPNSNKLMRPAFDMVPYSFMLESIKSKILELICADVKKYDMQVDPRLSIAFADGENGLECNLTDNTVGVIIQGNQDNPDNLELSFIHGTSMDNPSWSADIPLERFPVESLILIYNNLK